MKREKKILVSLSEKEYRALLDLANRKKMSKSQTIRDLILKRAVNKKIKEFEKAFEVFAEIYLVMSRVCGNLNQLAHHLNAGNFVADSNDFFTLADEMKGISKLFMQKCQEQQEKIKEII